LDIALELARDADVEHKWKTVGDAALSSWDLRLAEECFTHAKDLGSLLLIHTSSCNEAGLASLAKQADEAGARNVAFNCLWQLGDLNACIDLLIRTQRTAEAVFFAQTYVPSRAYEVVKTWKQTLESSGKTKVARLLGVPPVNGEGDVDLFPEWEEYLQLEREGGPKTENLIDVDDNDNDNNEEEETNDGEETNGEAQEEQEEAAAPVPADGAEEPESPQTDTEV
jgi:coatomer subunit beta'